MDEVRPSIERVHTEQKLPHVHYCTSIENMVREFDYDGVCIAELSPCLRTPWFNFKYNTDYDSSEESPSKKQCLRTRGGARPRAPPRTPVGSGSQGSQISSGTGTGSVGGSRIVALYMTVSCSILTHTPRVRKKYHIFGSSVKDAAAQIHRGTPMALEGPDPK